jgi:hypothetical protein
MRFRLYVNTKRIEFWGNFGWFSDPFILFSLRIFEHLEGIGWTVFALQVAKFQVSFGFEPVKP